MRTSATLLLTLVYGALIVYASLYPFEGWRAVGIAPWAWVWAPLPRYWTGFDVFVNFAGYAPLGLLLTLALRRRPWRAGLRLAAVVAIATALSFAMESLQTYLPQRVPSNVDWLLNTGGAAAGSALATLALQAGVERAWARWRLRWAHDEARAGWVLLALWPVGLLFPTAVPFGLGQVFERLEAAAAQWLAGTPMIEWLPLREIELEPLLPATELAVVLLSLLAPVLLAFLLVRRPTQRWATAVVVLFTGMAVTALSAALSYGPGHAWAWWTPPARVGLAAAAVLMLPLALLPRRAIGGVLLLVVSWQLSLINRAPLSPYLAQVLQTWEQGRFIRFHGLAQWVGWCWPYAVLLYVLSDLARRDRLRG